MTDPSAAPSPRPAGTQPAAPHETELTTPVSLTLPSGRLNPASIGFARSPLVDTSGIGDGTAGGATSAGSTGTS